MKKRVSDSCIYVQVKAFRKGHKPVFIMSHSKQRVLAKLKHAVAEKYYLKVTYAPGIYNDGFYTNKKDLLFAYRCFTDSDEVRFIREYNEIEDNRMTL